jgi:hypothetical protein
MADSATATANGGVSVVSLDAAVDHRSRAPGVIASLYLWHWPVLMIPARYAGHDLSPWQNLGLLLAAVAASAITFRLVENPVRNSPALKSRTGLTLAIGVVLILSTIAAAQWQIASHSGTRNPLVANVF